MPFLPPRPPSTLAAVLQLVTGEEKSWVAALKPKVALLLPGL